MPLDASLKIYNFVFDVRFIAPVEHMGLYSFYRISKPSAKTVEPEKVDEAYKSIRRRTFWGVTIAYSLYYVCRMSLSVVKQPLIDEGVLTAGELGLIGSALLFVYAVGKFMNGFIADYCINGWVQSMGSPPGVISLSRWFPQSKRGTYYSMFSSSPYIGEFLSFIITGVVVGALGWQYGFVVAAVAGLIGSLIILLFVSDTPESKGLPSVQTLSGEQMTKQDKMPTKELQKLIVRHPGIWVIAISSAFIYITKYAIAGWGVLFLQKARGFSLEDATQVIAFSAAFGVVGTVLAGWLSDKVFKSDRVKPAILSGIISMAALALFLFVGGGYVLNIIYVSLFSLAVGVLYCIVAGLMAVDIVPRKATGAALGVVGISSYVAAGLQDITSGYLIQGYMTEVDGVDVYNFGPVSWFWIAAALISFVLPVMNWKKMKINN